MKTNSRKWIDKFDEVKGVIFCTSLIDYAVYDIEDPTQNRMHEAIREFRDTVIKNKWLQSSKIGIFFTKIDTFTKKIFEVPLSVCFPEYEPQSKYFSHTLHMLSS